jgi:hypothetical protein
MLRPASWLALLSRTFTFELSLTGSPQANVEYNYVDKQSISTTGLSPASPTALWAAELGLTPRMSDPSDVPLEDRTLEESTGMAEALAPREGLVDANRSVEVSTFRIDNKSFQMSS